MKHISEIDPTPKLNLLPEEPMPIVQIGTYHGPQQRTLDEIDDSHPSIAIAVRVIHNWANRIRNGHTGSSLVFVGPSGTGKTHLATAIFWSIKQVATTFAGEQIPNSAVPVGRFFQADRIISEMDGLTRPANLIPIGSSYTDGCPLVVIDDVGTERTLPYISNQEREIQNRYYRIIEHCYTWNVAMVITSNLAFDGLRRVIGPRSWDRLQEMAPKGYMLDFAGVPSWRERVGGRLID